MTEEGPLELLLQLGLDQDLGVPDIRIEIGKCI